MISERTLRTLYGVAVSIGIDSNNPDGGLHHDTPDSEIVEVIVDIANGNPHNLRINQDELTESQCEIIVRSFYAGAYDR